MFKYISRLVIFMMIVGILYPGLSWGEEKGPQLDKKTREKINYVLVIDHKDGIEKALSEPIQIIREKLLTTIESQNDIRIERSSMVRVDKCLQDLFTSIPHLAKISAGNSIVRVQVELNAGTSQKSVWTQWQTRKLESPELKMTFFYQNKDVEPTEISCSGHKYH